MYKRSSLKRLATKRQLEPVNITGRRRVHKSTEFERDTTIQQNIKSIFSSFYRPATVFPLGQKRNPKMHNTKKKGSARKVKKNRMGEQVEKKESL